MGLPEEEVDRIHRRILSHMCQTQHFDTLPGIDIKDREAN